MTDFADEASERTEAQIAAALSNRMPEGPKATGYCLQCGREFRGPDGKPWPTLRHVYGADGKKIADVMRWCDSQCRDDWEKANG